MTFKEKLIQAMNHKAARSIKWNPNKAWMSAVASTTSTEPLHNLESTPTPYPWPKIAVTAFLVAVLAGIGALFMYGGG